MVARVPGPLSCPGAIRRTIITHHHIDHFGGLPEIVQETGAEVRAHQKDAQVVDGTTPRPALSPERVETMLARVPADLRLVGGEEMNLSGGVNILHSLFILTCASGSFVL